MKPADLIALCALDAARCPFPRGSWALWLWRDTPSGLEGERFVVPPVVYREVGAHESVEILRRVAAGSAVWQRRGGATDASSLPGLAPVDAAPATSPPRGAALLLPIGGRTVVEAAWETDEPVEAPWTDHLETAGCGARALCRERSLAVALLVIAQTAARARWN